MFSPEWSIASLPNCVDPNPTYLNPLDDPVVVCGVIFNERPPDKRCKVKGKEVVPDTFQMVLTEMKTGLGNGKPFLVKTHVLTNQPYPTTNMHYLVDHIMVPLTEGRAHRIMVDGKRPHPQTSLGSSSSQSPTLTQREVDPMDNYTLDLVVYCDQLLPILGEGSLEFKQTKGMFKCLGHFLSNLRKKK
ncbi:hypothetical protein Tco_1287821 [Tanacetum coccineum]